MDHNTRPTAPTAAPIPLTEDLPARLYGAVWGTDPTDPERTYLAECLDSYCVREAGSPLASPSHPWQAGPPLRSGTEADEVAQKCTTSPLSDTP